RHERCKPGFFWFANGLLLAAACLYRKCLMPKMITEKAFPSSHQGLMQILIEIQRVLLISKLETEHQQLIEEQRRVTRSQ
ncbi:MAG: hypothetical protein WCD78_24215, partial [Pseudolabrys sp.]